MGEGRNFLSTGKSKLGKPVQHSGKRGTKAIVAAMTNRGGKRGKPGARRSKSDGEIERRDYRGLRKKKEGGKWLPMSPNSAGGRGRDQKLEGEEEPGPWDGKKPSKLYHLGGPRHRRGEGPGAGPDLKASLETKKTDMRGGVQSGPPGR